MLVASYRREGQRGSPSPALIHADHLDARAALEAAVGPVAEFEVVGATEAEPEPEFAAETEAPAADAPADDDLDDEGPDLDDVAAAGLGAYGGDVAERFAIMAEDGEPACVTRQAWGLSPCPPPSPAEAWRICGRGRQAGPISPNPDEDLAASPEPAPHVPHALKRPATPAGDFLAPEDDPVEAVNWAREPLPDDGDPDHPEAPLPDRPRPVADPDWTARAHAAAEALRRLGGAA